MGSIFLSAGHHLRSPGRSGDPGAVALGTTEVKEVIETREAIEKIFEAQNIEYFSVPDHLTLKESISWINERSQRGDVAVELHCNAFNGRARGTEAYYIKGNSQRKAETQSLLKALLDEVPELKNRGAKDDTQGQWSRLAFCRDVDVASILVELCFIDNREDLDLLQNHRDRFARGLAKGLIEWSGQKGDIETDYPQIKIRLNGENLRIPGILANNNSYIPIDLVGQLRLD
ncbi:MAG: N-acetylmuramoyl-L-alanine amidase, partial [Crocosphaera sp.]|nr:N-acetylmuramoyl-L-alanine amidase [Crocosphaera sp.]